jgi:hypothetical protein
METTGQLHALAALPSSTHLGEGWVGPRHGLGAVECREKKIFSEGGNQTLILR